jgi:hypothetical protein
MLDLKLYVTPIDLLASTCVDYLLKLRVYLLIVCKLTLNYVKKLMLILTCLDTVKAFDGLPSC